MSSLRGLRERLTEMTEGSASREPLPAHLHIQEMKKIRKLYQHNIYVVKEGPLDFTCYMYALGFHCDEEVKRKTVWNSGFMKNLLVPPFSQEISREEAIDGDVVIYAERKDQTLILHHAGVIESDYVISAWGNYHVWRHGLWEVPSIYGNEDRYFRFDKNVIKQALS